MRIGSLSNKQTCLTVVIALLVGMIIGLVQIVRDFVEQQETVITTVKQAMEISRNAAFEAALQKSAPLAEQVVRELASYRPVYQVELIDTAGNRLALVERERVQTASNNWITWLFEDLQYHSLQLHGDKVAESVGSLHIALDTEVLADEFLQRAAGMLTIELVRALVLALILGWLFTTYLTRPLLTARQELLGNYPLRQAPQPLSPPRYHRDDEFGELISIINALLTDIYSYSQQREQLTALQQQQLETTIAEGSRQLEIAKRNELRSEKLVSLGRMTATVSHELRNPLGTIQSSFYVIKRELRDGSEAAQRALARIDRNITRCVNIIEQLLDFSREHQFHPQPVDLDTWLPETLADFHHPNEIILELHNDCHCQVNIDPERLRQALFNVLQNAWQAIQENNAHGHGDIHVYAECDCGRLLIRVIDNGPGIEEAVMRHVFEPLFSTKNFGVGLGLPLVRHIIKQHGGELEIRSQPGQGTEVIFDLPLTVSEALPVTSEANL